jgi:hypothetical protein
MTKCGLTGLGLERNREKGEKEKKHLVTKQSQSIWIVGGSNDRGFKRGGFERMWFWDNRVIFHLDRECAIH